MAAKDGGVGEQQQGVVEEALKHGRLHLQLSQELAADGRPTDQQGQDLTHQDGLQQAPGQSVGQTETKQITHQFFQSHRGEGKKLFKIQRYLEKPL